MFVESRQRARSGKRGRSAVVQTVAAYESDAKQSHVVGKRGATGPWPLQLGSHSLRWSSISSNTPSRQPAPPRHRPYQVFLRYFYLHIVLHCNLSFRAASRVLKAFELMAVGLLSGVPHLTTGRGWA